MRETREVSIMSICFRLVIFTIACLGFIGLFAPMSSAQVARTELHAIPTLTLSDRQFLTGDKNGTPVTIAGVLRIPRLGTDRLPAVILVHGSGGIGGNVDRWSQELNSIGLERFPKWLSRTLRRHARTCSGHPRLSCRKQDVDGRGEPGHDDIQAAGHVRSAAGSMQTSRRPNHL